MAVPVPPSIRVRLYQIEVNGGGTDLQKVAGTSKSYTTGGSTNDFHLVDLSELNETIEIEKGVYQIDSIHVTTDGLSATLFNTYDDPVNSPWVCEIYDITASAIIFHGPIDRKSVKYNPRTNYIDFDAVSWPYILEQTVAAARSVYETKMSKDYSKASSGASGLTFITIPRYADDGDDMNGLIVSGDVAVIQTPYGEWRGAILGIISTSATEILLNVLGEPENVALSNYSVVAAAASRQNWQIAANSFATVLQVTVSSATLWGALNALRQDIQTDDSLRYNSFVDVGVTYPTTGNQVVYRLYPTGTKNHIYSVQGQVGMNPRAWALSSDETTVTLTWDAPSAYITDSIANGLTINSVVIPTDIRKGSQVRILGKNVYGYAPSAGGTPFRDMYAKTEIVEGLFGLTDLGVFRFVTTVFTYPTGFSTEVYPRYLEWPDNLMDAIRLLQNTERSFLKFTPTLDGSSLPRLTVEMIRRDQAETGTLTSTAVTGIIEYQETGANLTPRGVRVEPHIQYNVPSGLKRYKTAGFYYDGIASDDPKTTTVPSGADVLTFKVNVTPDWVNGDVWVSNDQGVWNPDNLQTLAQIFWSYYADLSRPCSVLVDGEVARAVLGNFITINEGGLVRTIFVTGRKFNVFTKDTELSGLVGEFATVISKNPIAVVDGALLYHDTDSSGAETVRLSGMRSQSPTLLPLTYLWKYDPAGANTTIGTQAILEYSMSVGAATIRLTVSDGTNSDSEDVAVRVQNIAAAGTGFTAVTAQFSAGPSLSINSAGDVTVSAGGNPLTTLTTGGIEIEYSLTAASGPWTTVGTYDNPQNERAVYTGLAEDATIWVQVTLKNATDGTDGSVWIGSISNVLGGNIATLAVTTLNATDVNATGTITGDLTGNVTGDVSGNVTGDVTGSVNATNGVAAFGPAAVVSITVVNGIVTAIS